MYELIWLRNHIYCHAKVSFMPIYREYFQIKPLYNIKLKETGIEAAICDFIQNDCLKLE